MSRKTHRARARTKIVEAQLAKAQRRISRLRIEIGKLKQTAEDWESIKALNSKWIRGYDDSGPWYGLQTLIEPRLVRQMMTDEGPYEVAARLLSTQMLRLTKAIRDGEFAT